MWVLSVLSVCLAASGILVASGHPTGVKGCVLGFASFPNVAPNHTMSVGEIFYTGPEPCQKFTCIGPDHWTSLNCPGQLVEEGCEVVPGNMTAVYPACCPDVRCSDNILGVDQLVGKGFRK